MAPEPILMCWSGGKDSAMALQATLQDPSLKVEALLTAVTDGDERTSMHGVRRILLEQQASALHLPLEQVRVSTHTPHASYEAAMREVLMRYQARGVSRVIFGDLFLEEIRASRERQLAQLGMRGLYPLWRKDTRKLAHQFIDSGFQATLVCVDPNQLDPLFCGRDFDWAMLADLPVTTDPCGENGEFHTFVHAGPIFRRPIPITKGAVVERDGVWFCDLEPTGPVERHPTLA